jgi:hypothetical protein
MVWAMSASCHLAISLLIRLGLVGVGGLLLLHGVTWETERDLFALVPGYIRDLPDSAIQ